MPAISIIIPIYNGESYIKRMVNLLNMQACRDFEVVFVNDGSVDNTFIALQKEKKKFTYKIINQENQGVSAARNTGIMHSSGDYLCFIDIDDEISPYYLSVLHEACKSFHSRLSISPFTIYQREICSINKSVVMTQKKKNEILSDYLFKKTNYTLSAALIARELFENNNLLFPVGYRYSEDVYILWQLFALVNHVVVVNEYLYCYNQNASSVMHSAVDLNRQDAIELMKKLEPIMQSLAPDFIDFSKFAVARHYWSIVWQAARYYSSYGSFADFCAHFPLVREMKKLETYPDLRISTTASLYLASPRIYYVALHLLMKMRWLMFKY